MLRTIVNSVKRHRTFEEINNFRVKLENGRPLVSGDNSYGQLGHPESVSSIEKPTPVPNLNERLEAAHSSLSNVYLTTRHTVLSAGLNTDNQLGRSFNHSLSHTFKQVEWDFGRFDGVKQLSTNGDTATVLTMDGSVVGWGNSEYGSLCSVEDKGVEPRNISEHLDKAGCRYITKISVAGAHSWFLNDTGEVWNVGLQLVDENPVISPIPNKLELPCKALNIWSGVHHSAAFLEDETLYISGPQLDRFTITTNQNKGDLERLVKSKTLDSTFGFNSILLHS
ncbi:RCC1/BLIP-II [Wallemia mellicola CBS 633.66]|uniref:RCC1/BLIP-II n=1 Tax=Wallemia mellicola (strain ATCC MYA-4683 / CBS 633.66) TaxID=671144 RepID=I4Y6U8_WALMC|nr:RCC1/BLIP-II [Wallemia mellicola CBS 633.66]EIM19690.1 RCC1/BLIP-II [Wallemia mellicola CBS 633.66]TIC07732.1 RCC1/BLIP-II [Wallemia mellicola]TIC49442.1 RCC1/BLIP-II [Wallemia mellicola]|eukprot:XP_006960198.1 RCC1/BLIP-II [Wallemia mellicola CBS 633.66]